MWPAKASCAAHDAFLEYSNKQHLSYLIYSAVFKSARPASEQVPLKRIYSRETTMDTFRRKSDVKAVCNKVQVQPLMRQRDNATVGESGGHSPQNSWHIS